MQHDVYISYRQAEPDATIAARLQSVLERYRAPRTLVRKGAPHHIGHVYRRTGALTPADQEALLTARFLVVVCSPRTPASDDVNREIDLYRTAGHGDHILALLIEGEPAESFPRPLREVRVGDDIVEVEPLAADVRAPDLRGALRLLKTESLRLLAPIFGFGYDDLRQRHRERLVRRAVLVATVATLAGLTFGSYSFYRWQDAARAARAADDARLGAEAAALRATEATERAARGAAEANRQTAAADEQRNAADAERGRAERGEADARLQTEMALAATREADAQRVAALAQRDRALRAQSLFLADKSRQETGAGRATLGMLLALEALPKPGAQRPLVGEAVAALYAGVNAGADRTILAGHKSRVLSASFSPDGRWVLTIAIDGDAWLWDAQSGRFLYSLREGAEVPYAFSFSPDGRWLASGSDDGRIRIWELASGRLAQTWQFSSQTVTDVQFSRDGSLLATSTAKVIQLWETATWRQTLQLTGHTDEVQVINFSPDSRRLVSGCADGTGIVWSLTSGEPVAKLVGHTAAIYNAKFSPDGRRIVTRSADGLPRVWDAATGELVHALEGHTDYVWTTMFSPDGSRVLTSSADGVARVWDTESGELTVSTPVLAPGVHDAQYTPDGQFFVTAGYDTTIRMFDASSGREVRRLLGHTQVVGSVDLSPDGRRIASAANDNTAAIWDLDRPYLPIFRTAAHKTYMATTEFSPDGRVLLTSGEDNTPRLWDVTTGDLVGQLTGHTDVTVAASFSPDGRHILTGSDDGTAMLWDVRTLRPVRVYQGGGDVRKARFSPDGRLVALGTTQKEPGDNGEPKYVRQVRIYETETGRLVHTLNMAEFPFYFLVFSPDGSKIAATTVGGFWIWDLPSGRLVVNVPNVWVFEGAFSPRGDRFVVGRYDQTAGVYDTETGASVLELVGHQRLVYCTAFSPDGRRILTGSGDSTLRLWDAATGASLAVLTGHDKKGMMYACGFTRDGAYIYSGSDDRTARLWNGETGEAVAVFEGHRDTIENLAFSPDGHHIATGDLKGEFAIWQFFPTVDELVTYAASTVPRTLTPEERTEFALEAAQ